MTDNLKVYIHFILKLIFCQLGLNNIKQYLQIKWGRCSRLTTDKCPFLALATSSSDPGVKSMIPSFPWPTVNFILEEEHRQLDRLSTNVTSHTVKAVPAPHLPWLMLMLFILSAQIAILVKVSITWSLCRTTSPCEDTIKQTLSEDSRKAPWDLFHSESGFYLLFVVVTGHVQNEQAIAERADWDTCRRKDAFNDQWTKHCPHTQKQTWLLTSDLSELRSRCAVWVWPPLR